MPLFFFDHIHGTERIADDAGRLCPDALHAAEQALLHLPDAARAAFADPDAHLVRIDVRNERNVVIFSTTLHRSEMAGDDAPAPAFQRTSRHHAGKPDATTTRVPIPSQNPGTVPQISPSSSTA